MSEKYITLNHLETATKSLIAKIDEEINDLDETLSPVAKSGDYEDLENKPNIISDYNELNNTPNIFEIEFYKEGNYWHCSQTYSAIDTAINNGVTIIAKYADAKYSPEGHVDFKNYYYNSDSSSYSFSFVESSIDKNYNIVHHTDITFTVNNVSTLVSYTETDNSYPIGSNSTPDWNQNDSTADDYIENRTHWKDIDEDFIWVEGNLSAYNTSGLKTFYLRVKSTLFLENKTYIVTYDNVNYSLSTYPITATSSGNTIYALGNSNYLPSTHTVDSNHDTSIPFLIINNGTAGGLAIIRRSAANSSTNDTSIHSLKITGPIYVYHTIDNLYLNGKLITEGTGNYAEIFNYNENEASGSYSHAEGYHTIASNTGSHAEGYHAVASGSYSHAEGTYRNYNVKITGEANALTYSVIAGTDNPPRIGDATTSVLDRIKGPNDKKITAITLDENSRINTITFEETYSESAVSNQSFTLWIKTTAAASDSHAEGCGTLASGLYSHAEGIMTEAIGVASHAQNECTIAKGNRQTVMGTYNIPDTTSALIIGNGNQATSSNAYTLDWSGNGIYAGKVTVGTAPTADMDVATKLYVDTAMSNVSTDLVGLTDTTITTPTDGQILIYDATNSKWINSNFTAVSPESDTNVNNMLDSFSLDYTSNTLSPNLWVGGSY